MERVLRRASGALSVVLAAGAVVFAASAAAAPPDAISVSVGDVTPTTATVGSSYRSRGLAHTAVFSADPGGGLPVVTISESFGGSGGDPLLVLLSRSLTGLRPFTAYDLAFTVTSADGSDSVATTFTTPAADATATSGAATAITQTTATVNGVVDTGGPAAQVHFELTPSAGGATIVTSLQALAAAAGPREVSAPVTDLAPSTSYDVVVVLTTNAPDSATSTATSFTTATPAPTNVAPKVSVVAGLACGWDERSGAFALTYSDRETAARRLRLSVANDNPALVRATGVAGINGLGGVAIVAQPGRSGTATVTVTVSDGQLTGSTSITVKVGGAGSDTLVGTEGADLLLGQRGKDTLSGLGGPDLLCGGSGDDRLTGGAGPDRFSGGGGRDVATDLNRREGDTQDGSIP